MDFISPHLTSMDQCAGRVDMVGTKLGGKQKGPGNAVGSPVKK